jgi:hypothetical protein
LVARADEIVDLLKIGVVLQKKRCEGNCLIGELQGIRVRKRSMRVGIMPQEIVGGAPAAGLVLFTDEGREKTDLIRSEFHG